MHACRPGAPGAAAAGLRRCPAHLTSFLCHFTACSCWLLKPRIWFLRRTGRRHRRAQRFSHNVTSCKGQSERATERVGPGISCMKAH